MGQETISLTRAEMKKVLVIQKCVDQVITHFRGKAEALSISQRQVIRLKIRLKKKEQKVLSTRTVGRNQDNLAFCSKLRCSLLACEHNHI
jgi:hypothetical protein